MAKQKDYLKFRTLICLVSLTCKSALYYNINTDEIKIFWRHETGIFIFEISLNEVVPLNWLVTSWKIRKVLILRPWTDR